MMTGYVEYVIERSDFIPVDLWGKDHWSTFAYLETRAVDNNGVIKNVHMRCNPRLHSGFAHAGSFMGGDYPTIIKGGKKVERHDDWSCVEDMIVAGLITVQVHQIAPADCMECIEAKVSFTDLGALVAAALRRHKMVGGTFSNFEWKEEDNTNEGNL